MVRIREVRLAHGLTIAQLAERIAEHGVSITEAGISNVETGAKQASDRLLVAWARALGIQPLDVWHGPLRKAATAAAPPRRSATASDLGKSA
jgi:transcriptional regulator with XRE-family HTH domain